MKTLLLFLGMSALSAAGGARAGDPGSCPPLLDVEVRRLAGDETVRLCDAYRGKAILIVNTASKCGFTPQYDGLEALYRKYRDRGLVVLGFPSNDFMGQEPRNEGEIARFCRLTYKVEFPMFAKSHVRKGAADPLFQRLAAAGAPYPKWNFFKYLIDPQGRYVDYWSSLTPPSSERIAQAIELALPPAADVQTPDSR
jgi:glutathione peroxidase